MKTKTHRRPRPIITCPVLFLVWLLAPLSANAEWAGHQYMPITWAEALDASTLNIQTTLDKTIPSRTHSGSFRAVKFRYHSHDWDNQAWSGHTVLAVPDTFDPRFDGRVLAMVPSSGELEDYFRDLDLLEYTAMEWGIPVMTIPWIVLPGDEHYDLDEIHDLRDFMQTEAWERLDIEWSLGLHAAAARSRGVTAVGELIGRDIGWVIHFGSSIEAAHSWIWTAFDPRSANLLHSGDLRWPQARRLESETVAPPDFVEEWAQVHQPLSMDDPSVFDMPMMLYYGTNDGFVPLGPVEEYMDLLPRKPHLIFSPKYGHGTGDLRALESFRMWMDHRAEGRPLSTVTLNDLEVDGENVVVEAAISGGPDVEEANFYYATYSDPEYLESHLFPTTPLDNYRDANWVLVPMTQNGDRWEATIDISGVSDDFLAGYVDVKDSVDGRIGYASSPFKWVQIGTGG